MTSKFSFSTKLHNARILILGGSSGIGHAVAAGCLEFGAYVAIASSSSSRVDSAVAALQERYPESKEKVCGLVVDLGGLEGLEGEVERVLREAGEWFGRCGGGEEEKREGKIDHVVYTAGDKLAKMGLGDMNITSILSAGTTRFFAPLLLATHLTSYLPRHPSSSFTLTTGSVSQKPLANWSVIASYAGGLHAMVRNLALDLAPIRVNGVSPGVVDTGLWGDMEEGKREEMMRSMGEKLATGRVGRAEDVAESYLGLMRDWNATGSMVSSNGGGLIM